MALIENDVILQAKAVDLKSFLENEGFSFKKESVNNYRCNEEHTLLITYKYNNPIYFWYNKAQRGNIVDYVMANITNNNFRMAINYILKDGNDRTSLTMHYVHKPIEYQSTTLDIKYSNDKKHVYGYLCKTRGINFSIVNELVNKGLLAEDEMHNALFLHLNQENKVVGADKCGTNSYKRFKGVVTGSNPEYGFSIKVGESINFKDIKVFEAPIDLLSFLQMNQGNLDDCLLLSIGGSSKTNVIQTYLNTYKSVETICVCTDKDDAGDEAYLNIKNKYVNYSVVDGRESLVIANVKDFNGLLLKK